MEEKKSQYFLHRKDRYEFNHLLLSSLPTNGHISRTFLWPFTLHCFNFKTKINVALSGVQSYWPVFVIMQERIDVILLAKGLKVFSLD